MNKYSESYGTFLGEISSSQKLHSPTQDPTKSIVTYLMEHGGTATTPELVTAMKMPIQNLVYSLDALKESNMISLEGGDVEQVALTKSGLMLAKLALSEL